MKQLEIKKNALFIILILYCIIGLLALIYSFFIKADKLETQEPIVMETIAKSSTENSGLEPDDIDSLPESSTKSHATHIDQTPMELPDADSSFEPNMPTQSENTTDTSGYTYQVILSPDKRLNIRSMPDTASDILGRLAYRNTGDVLEVGGTWTLIQTPDGICGYVLNEYISIFDKTGAELIQQPLPD